MLRPLRALACQGQRGERGQMLLLMMGFLALAIVMFAIVVDLGLILGERREAQKDADAAALAGAQELAQDFTAPDGGAADAAEGEAVAHEWILRNGVNPDSATTLCPTPDSLGDTGVDVNVCTDRSCYSDHPNDTTLIDSITVDVQGPGDTHFADVFDVDVVEVGAHAKACVGSLKKAKGLQPWIVSLFNSPCFEWIDVDGDTVKDEPYNPDLYLPRFGEDCVIRLESPSSQVGSIRLGDDPGDECNEPGGGADKYRENIIEGSDAWCELGQLIDTEPGLNVGPTLQALEERLSTEGACDARYGQLGDGRVGIDDFPEVFTDPSGGLPTADPSPDNVYMGRECDDDPADEPGEPDSPRVVNIVILDEFDGTGMDTRPIRGFAGFFIYQCEELDKSGNIVAIYPKCDPPGSAGANFQIRGTFIQYVYLGGEAGPLDPFGTRVIVLVE